MFDSLAVDSASRHISTDSSYIRGLASHTSELSRAIGLISSIKRRGEERQGRPEEEWFEDRVASTVLLYDFFHSQSNGGIRFRDLCNTVLRRLAHYRGNTRKPMRFVCRDDAELSLDPDAALMLGLAIDNLMASYAEASEGCTGVPAIGFALREQADARIILSILELSERNDPCMRYGFKSSAFIEHLVSVELGGSISITEERIAKAAILLDKRRIGFAQKPLLPPRQAAF